MGHEKVQQDGMIRNAQDDIYEYLSRRKIATEPVQLPQENQISEIAESISKTVSNN